MRFGVIIDVGDVRERIELAAEAERAGWDGVFVSDCIAIEIAGESRPDSDPWLLLAGMAMRTERVKLGALLTPVSRRRPWKLARETVTLDHLSGGRVIFAAGLGAVPDDAGFGRVGEATDRKTRAELLDEGLEILNGLWSGEPYSFNGRHYQIDTLTLKPPPLQSPRIPIWTLGLWPNAKSIERAFRWDGVIAVKREPGGEQASLEPDEVRALRAEVANRRDGAEGFEIVITGMTPIGDLAAAAAKLAPYAGSGLSWWVEEQWPIPSVADMRARILQGPPRPR